MRNIGEFKSRGQFIALWQIRGSELYEAAEVVWNSKVIRSEMGNGLVDELHEQYRPAMLLMGLSLESLIKGLLIERDNSLVDGGKINAKIKTHDLISLFRLAAIPIVDNTEADFLKRLTAHVIWISKYATPTKIINNNGQDIINLFTRFDTDFETFKKLFNLIAYEFTSNDRITLTTSKQG